MCVCARERAYTHTHTHTHIVYVMEFYYVYYYLYYSRKQYSPLSPSSPEESDSPLERINIDLMHELRDVIFPNTPPVDRTVSLLQFTRYLYITILRFTQKEQYY